MDLSGFKPVKARSINAKECSISIVNTAENGRRVKLSKSALKSLGTPETVQFAVSDDALIMASKLDDNPEYFKISKGCIYSSDLVIELTNFFNLDFSGKTSLTFSADEVQLDSGLPALVINLN